MRAGDCSICRRRDCGDLAKAKAGGESTRSIARRTGVSEPTLRRHFSDCRTATAGCHARPPAAAQASPPAAQPPAGEPLPAELVAPALPEGDPRAPILAEMARQYGELGRALERAQTGKDDRGVATVIQQMRGLTKQHADIVLRGWRPEPPEVERVLTSPLIHRVFRRVADALLPFPEARDAVVAVLRDGGVNADE